jgi:hypothetical protein
MAPNRSPRHPLFHHRWFADDVIIPITASAAINSRFILMNSSFATIVAEVLGCLFDEPATGTLPAA